jgi:flagellar L-ring protein precursor FlgH
MVKHKSMKIMFVASLAVAVCLQVACVKHIGSYEPKRRQYDMPSNSTDAPSPSQDGSLWAPGLGSNYFFSDQRALLVSDIVTVRISEVSSAFSNASTSLDRSSEVDVGINAMMGFLAALQQANPNFDRNAIVGASTSNGFEGKGSTSRRGEVKATVPAVVRKLLPNGNLFVEGHRAVLVNDEEYHFYISGVIRPIDIDETNGVDSAKIADAEIEFTGRGTVSEKQTPGWLARLMDWTWPF